MNSIEKRALLALASITSTRMLGLFMILPVFAIYAQDLPNVTPTLIGLAMGIYGLTQAIFQIPFGMLSDRFGRKPIITIGLLMFAFGSVIAALSTSIIGIIIGRALQGSGAIAAAVLALAADLTREEHRTKAMGILGVSIGFSFTLALIIGPLLNRWIGVPGLFWFAALLALLALALLHLVVPQPLHSHLHREAEPVPSQFKRVLADTQLLRLDFGVLVVHLLITSLFVVLPISLATQVDADHHWLVYLPVLIAAFIATVPSIIIAEKYRHLKFMFVSAIGLLGLSQFGLIYLHNSLTGVVVMLFFFFTAVSILEASLPSLVSKLAPSDGKGTAMGLYSTGQFLGLFLGGVSGGWLHHYYSVEMVFILGTVLTVVWFMVAATMQNPRYLSSELLNVGVLDKTNANQLTNCLAKIPGVAEVVVILEEGIAYLKIDRQVLDLAALKKKCPMMSALLKS
jgi:MFS family permease